MRISILSLLVLLFACYKKDKELVIPFQGKGIKNEDKLFLGTGMDINEHTYEYKPSLDKYCCFFDDSTGFMIISFGWFSGESFKIIKGEKEEKLFMRSGGCGLFDSYNYITKHQTLVFTDSNLNEIDTIKGYIEYIGIQDVAGMKARFKKYEDDLSKYYGISMSYFDTLTPKTFTIAGNFILPKCTHSDSTDIEYHVWMIQDAKMIINGY